MLSKFGYYKPIQFFGFALLGLGTGLAITLTPETKTVVWVVFLAITAIGLASVMTNILPAALAPLDESDVALATGVFSFLRSFGFMWGSTFSVVVFNSAFDQFIYKIRDQTVRAVLGRGQAFESISSPYIDNLPTEVRREVIGVFDDALNVVWEVAVALAGCGMLLVLVEKHVPLRTQLDTKYGLEEKSRNDEDQERGDGKPRGAKGQTEEKDGPIARQASGDRREGPLNSYSAESLASCNNASTRDLVAP